LWVIDLDKARFHRTAYMAAKQQQRGWEQFMRSAAKCGTTEVIHFRVKLRSAAGAASLREHADSLETSGQVH
jgi:hypothetical protein